MGNQRMGRVKGARGSDWAGDGGNLGVSGGCRGDLWGPRGASTEHSSAEGTSVFYGCVGVGVRLS